MGSLQQYYKKRKFNISPEPKGNVKKKAGNVFVVQKHAAGNLHYDFRIEFQGVLKSWAVPKQPPLKAGIKRLAIQTEDHPVEYASFKGMIPKGEYGAGKVEIWDKGEYKLLKKTKKAYVVELFGKKMKGIYVLFNLKDKSWFLFKRKKDSKNKKH